MVKPPEIFLRAGCVLPHALRVRQRRFDEAWMSVENAAPAQLDRAVRDVGWNFIWIEPATKGRGCGRTDEAAARRAIAHALAQTSTRFNAAELGILRIARCLGFRVAKVTLHTRHIQRRDALMDEGPEQQAAAK